MDPRAYPEHAAVEERHWWFRGRRALARSEIASWRLRDGARVLELGCGTGGNLAMLGALGHVVAVEPDASAREVARARHPSVELISSVDELAGPAFDAAFAFDVLEHLDEPRAVLRRLRAFCVPQAPLLVTVPQHPWLFGAHDRFLHHARRYTERSLRDDLAAGGFEVERVRQLSSLALPAACAARAIEIARALVGRPAPPAPRGMSVPPEPLNSLLRAAYVHEPRQRLPTGLGLMAVARAAPR